jgi:hypothetical protein
MALITASPANFARLLEIQTQSLAATRDLHTLLSEGPPSKRDEEKLDLQKEQLELEKEQLQVTKDELIASKAFLSIGDRLKGLAAGLSNISGTGIKQGILKSLNFGGMLNKTIAKNDFIKSQKDLGSTKSNAELKQDFEVRNTAKKDYDSAEKTIAEAKKQNPGVSEEELRKRATGNSKIGQAFQKKDSAIAAFGGVKPVASNAEQNKAFDVSEADAEETKRENENNEFLKTIADNTTALKPASERGKPEAPAQSGGLLSGLAGGAGKALEGMKSFGIGLVAIAAGLWVASKALENFGNIEWESIGKGMVALGGLVASALLLDKVKGEIIKGAAVLGILALATWGIGEVFKGFAELEWESIGKGFAMIAGLGVIAAIMGAAAPLLFLGAAALGAIGLALIPFAAAMAIAAPGMDSFASMMERLSSVDAANIALLGPALVSLAAGMIAFGGAGAVAGVTNLVGGLLSKVSGQKSPVDQIIALGEHGVNIEKAGIGVEKLGDGLKMFSSVDPDKIKAIAALPVEKIAAMGAAMGSANQVYDKSGANAGAAAAPSGGGNNSAVIAPTTNNISKTNQLVQLPIRNQEQSMNRYLRSKFA